MYLLSANLYELGQFLQILLWISLPMVLVALLVTTYLHYRNKRRDIHRLLSPEDGTQDPSETTLFPAPDPTAGWQKDKLRSPSDRLASSLFVGDPTAALPEESGNAYRGLLWMKDKYEQYREQTDRKIEKLKEDLARSEEKVLDLQVASTPHSQQPESAGLPDLSTADEKDLRIEGLQLELEQRIRDYHQLQYQYQDEQTQATQLSEQYAQVQELVKTRQFEIEELNTRLLQQQHKLTDLTYKLECNTQLLLRIHQELDSSLHERQNQEVSKIVGWV